MSILVSCQNLEKSFGHRTLFEGLTFGVYEGERWGIIGSNGSGKSTLMKILAREETPDDGGITYRNDLRVAYLPQEENFEPSATVRQLVAHSARDLDVTEVERDVRVSRILSQAGFTDPDRVVSELSGGWKKRVAIACQMVKEPHLLILDEPTNHLDLSGIDWLEGALKQAPYAIMVVTHDRTFLENTASIVVEMNRLYPGGLLKIEGNYTRFLEKRTAYHEAEAQREASLSNRVKQEIAWLRQGPKARTTKASFRVEQAHALREDLDELRALLKHNTTPDMEFSATRRKTKRLLVARGLKKAFGDKLLFDDLDIILSPKMRLGLLGLNGSGKTTLLRVLAGELAPDEGTVRYANDLRLVRFDQERKGLNQQGTVQKALAPDGDMVMFEGRQVHVRAWAKRFGFTEEFLKMKVGDLSGGEQARILLAMLMLEPADLLFLDEPTNDLDLPALEMLEESLERFPGAIVMVTHDRWMLDRLSTVMVGLDGAGKARLYGDFTQWLRDLHQDSKEEQEAGKVSKPRVKKKSPLSYLEKKEFETIEGDIANAEEAVSLQQVMLENPAIASDAGKAREHFDKLQEAERTVEQLYARWEELQSKIDEAQA